MKHRRGTANSSTFHHIKLLNDEFNNRRFAFFAIFAPEIGSEKNEWKNGHRCNRSRCEEKKFQRLNEQLEIQIFKLEDFRRQGS